MLANAGLPMISLQWAFMVLALVPVVAVEAVVYRRSLDLGWRKVILGSLAANTLTTAVGVPLAWLAWLLLQVVLLALPFARLTDEASPLTAVLGAAWLGFADERLYVPMIPVALSTLLLPSFLVSVWLERWALRTPFRNVAAALRRRAIWRANTVSYLGLFVLTTAAAVAGCVDPGEYRERVESHDRIHALACERFADRCAEHLPGILYLTTGDRHLTGPLRFTARDLSGREAQDCLIRVLGEALEQNGSPEALLVFESRTGEIVREVRFDERGSASAVDR